MMGTFNSSNLRKLAAGGGAEGSIKKDAMQRVMFRSDQDKGNANRILPPQQSLKGLPPEIAGAMGGGMPQYLSPMDTQAHMQGNAPERFKSFKPPQFPPFPGLGQPQAPERFGSTPKSLQQLLGGK